MLAGAQRNIHAPRLITYNIVPPNTNKVYEKFLLLLARLFVTGVISSSRH